MLDKASAPQLPVGPADTVLNVYRYRGDRDEPVAAFAPRSLDEHAHATLQISVLLRETIASVGWHDDGGKSGKRRVFGGTSYVVPFDQPHDFRLHRPRGMVNFHIDRDALVGIGPADCERRFDVLNNLAVIDDAVIDGVAAGVHATALEPGALTPLYLDAAWTMLAPRLAWLVDGRPVVARTGALAPWRLRRALEYIDGKLGSADLRVADVASVAGLSAVHFTRSFTRSAGATPMQYIIGRRLDRARDRLANEHASVATIAFEFGFGSHARFSEAFRRRFGVSPQGWRRSRSAPE